MSHFTTIKTQIRDVAALRAASTELKLELQGNGIAKMQARGYASQTRSCDYSLRLKGPYDIAVDKQADGTYALTTDWWAGHVANEVGQNFSRLVQLYGVNKAIIEARKRGLAVNRQTQADGSIRLAIATA